METLPEMLDTRWLFRHRACPEQRNIFSKEWPNGAMVTEENLIQASKIGMNLLWFVGEILPDEVDNAFKDACNEVDARYKKERTPLWDAHRETFKPVWKERIANNHLLNARYGTEAVSSNKRYQAELTLLNENCNAAIDVLEADYKKKVAPLEARYQADINMLSINAIVKGYAKQR